MNTEATPTEFEVSFIHDERRVQARGVLTDEQQCAIGELMSSSSGARPQALGLMPVSGEDDAGMTMGAEHLVETITEAIGLDEDEDNSAWDKVMALAKRVDALAGQCSTPKTLMVEFIWNNGGGDDNLFGQGFVVDGAGPDNEALVDEFTQALESAGEESFYDMGVVTGNGNASDNYMSTDDLLEWMDEVDEDGDDNGLQSLRAALTARPAARPAGMR